MSSSQIQLSLFSNKVPIDKNLSFSTVYKEGQPVFKFDLQESFDEDPQFVLDVLLFFFKLQYDNPSISPSCTLQDFADFTGRPIKKIRKLSKGPKSKEYSNDYERVVYKLVNRNMILNTSYLTPSGELKEVFEPFPLISRYVRTTRPDGDKRVKYYKVRLNEWTVMNFSTFLFYVATNDYKYMTSNYYRNPRFRFLFLRLGALINNLKAGIEDRVTFNELAHILNYNAAEDKETKRMIKSAVDKMLALDTFKGLAFRWTAKGNGLLYNPHFHLTEESKTNPLNETRHDKWKRVDMMFLSALNPFKDQLDNEMLYGNDLKEITSSFGNRFYTCLQQAFSHVLKKEPSSDQISHFYQTLTYKDDYENLYASDLTRHIQVAQMPLLENNYYKSTKISMLF